MGSLPDTFVKAISVIYSHKDTNHELTWCNHLFEEFPLTISVKCYYAKEVLGHLRVELVSME